MQGSRVAWKEAAWIFGLSHASVEFCFKAGLTYVSCSPFRVPIARLAAAQSSIKFGK
jgi:pyruvate, orthophosphate dikinase